MIRNLVGAEWSTPEAASLDVYNPATGAVIDTVPLSPAADVDRAVAAARRTFDTWSREPLTHRVALMFRFRELLEAHREELASLITLIHGKTREEARGEVRRGIENVDFACGAPTLLQGRTVRQITQGVDQDTYRYPVGVVAGIPPFNFPVMIPLWMFPLAVVAGNTVVLKPSERTPTGAQRLAELFLEAGFPEGVLNIVHGAAATVDALLAHPDVAAVSFVGSEPVARHVYATATAHGKRVQALGGAKNHIVVMPDADLELAVPNILNSAFGNAGERCLAGSVAVGVGAAGDEVLARLASAARELRVGPGEDPDVQVGPLIRREHRDRVADAIAHSEQQGGSLVVDGRGEVARDGFFLGPTVVDGAHDGMDLMHTEVFGPVLSYSRAHSIDDALEQANRSQMGNMAVIFTSDGRNARRFREEVQAGMVGINVPVAQPFAFHPFSGWKRSFYGDLHVNGPDGVRFYTEEKVVVTRW